MVKEAIDRTEIKVDSRKLAQNGPIPVSSLLYQLMEVQRAAQGKTETVSTTALTRKDIFEGFQLTPRFKEIYRAALKFHLVPHTGQEMQDFRGRMAGAVFEGSASHYLLLSIPQSQTILSPDQVLRVYQRLYHTARKLEHPLGMFTLKGISVPDNLVIENYQLARARIVAVCESSLSGNPDNYLKHYHGFIRDKENYPRVFKNARLIFVTPEKPDLPYEDIKRVEADWVELPFTRRQFREYLDSLYEFYRPSSHDQTLLEIQEQVCYQSSRVSMPFVNGKSG